MLVSGLSSMLFPKGKAAEKTPAADPDAPKTEGKKELSLAEYAAALPAMLPILWQVGKPILLSWGMKKAQRSIVNFFFKKKVAGKK